MRTPLATLLVMTPEMVGDWMMSLLPDPWGLVLAWAGVLVAGLGTIWTGMKVVYRVSVWWHERGKPKPATPDAAFPFRVSRSAGEFAEYAAELGSVDNEVPYQNRLPQAVVRQIDASSFVMLRGQTGLGKTREAIEAVRRLEVAASAGRGVTVLVPPTSLTDWTWPSAVPHHRVVLYLDNLHEHTWVDEGQAPPGSMAAWLPRTLRQLAQFPPEQVKVIATLRDDLPQGLPWEQQLGCRPNHPLWGKFVVLPLDEWELGDKAELIDAYAKQRNLRIDEDARRALAAKTDGRARSVLSELAKRSPGTAVTKAMVDGWPGRT